MAGPVNIVEIDLAAIRRNYRLVQDICGPTVRVMAVVKSDAYGHGMVPVSKALRQEGACVFGVAEVEEGIALRQAGMEGDIVVLVGTWPDEADQAVRHRLTPVVFDEGILPYLDRAAAQNGCEARVHLKVDVGMGRLGLLPEEALRLLEAFDQYPSVSLAGILSHFPVADEPEKKEVTREQICRFEAFLAQARLRGKKTSPVHIANSAGVIHFPQSHVEMVRPGISLYGGFAGWEESAVSTRMPDRSFAPAMRFSTRVTQVKEVPAGWGISYGHLFVTRRPTRLAVLPVGYADGYLRKLTGRASVLLHGRRAPVVGRICMKACMVDVTDLTEVCAGDEAVLMGRQAEGEITATEMASWMGTITYEVFCLFGSMNRKVFLGSPSYGHGYKATNQHGWTIRAILNEG